MPAVALCGLAPVALAQGQDSTPGERNLKIMAELLPGVYDNVNQNYFDQRRKLSEADRHARVNTTITRVTAPAFGPYVFLWVNRTTVGEATQESYRLATLATGGADDEVIMRQYLRLEGAITDEELAR